MNRKHVVTRARCVSALAASLSFFAAVAAPAPVEEGRAFIPRLIISSTIPENGDLNPYGIAFVPKGFPAGGALAPGDVLVANFNASNNLQGTGTTIIKFRPDGAVAPSVPVGQSGNAVTFFQGNSKQPGLTTALGTLRRGYVVVGNLPTTDGTANTIKKPPLQSALQIVNRFGKLVATWTDDNFFDSPWDLTIDDDGDHALLFVSNVLSGKVSRLDLEVGASTVTLLHKTLIATGYKHEPNLAALVVGPTGLAYDEKRDILYVASTDDNAIFMVAHAGKATAPVNKGTLVFADSHLRGPLGLAFAPNGNLLTANGDAVNSDPTHPSEIIEFTKGGEFVREFNLDAGADAAFGVAAMHSEEAKFNFAVDNDNTNGVAVYSLPED
jgi:hypothetical protein